MRRTRVGWFLEKNLRLWVLGMQTYPFSALLLHLLLYTLDQGCQINVRAWSQWKL